MYRVDDDVKRAAPSWVTFAWRRAIVVVTVVAIVLAGCGDDEPAPVTPRPTGEDSTPTIEPREVVASPTAGPVGTPRGTPIAVMPTGSPPVVEPVVHSGQAAMAAAVDRLLVAEPGVYGVILVTPRNETIYSRNADTPFIAASLYKLVLMACVYELEERGALTLHELIEIKAEYFADDDPALDGLDSYFHLGFAGEVVPVEEALYAAVAHSSNVAARALLARVGGPEAVNRKAQALGLTHTHFLVEPATLPDWPPVVGFDSTLAITDQAARFVLASAADGPVNITTPRDVATFYSLLLEGEVVSPRASAAMLDILKKQVIRDRLPWFLPAGTVLAHKTGNLDHVVHDAGVIYAPAGPVIVAALVEGVPDDARAMEIIRRLALIAYGTYEVPPIPEAPDYGEYIDGDERASRKGSA